MAAGLASGGFRHADFKAWPVRTQEENGSSGETGEREPLQCSEKSHPVGEPSGNDRTRCKSEGIIGKREDGKVIPLDVKTGDRILFGKYSGSEIKLDGVEHLILREEDILGVLEA